VTKVGSWWSRKGEAEIDVVAMKGGDYILLGSCKWAEKVNEGVLNELYESRAALGKQAARARLALFGRRGFGARVRERAETENVLLVTANDLFAV
jgi:hypothetical protein